MRKPAQPQPIPVSVSDLRLNLQETDYADLFDEAQSEVRWALHCKVHRAARELSLVQPLTDKFIKTKCREKLANEFNFMRNQSGGNAAKFMDFVQCVAAIKPGRTLPTLLRVQI